MKAIVFDRIGDPEEVLAWRDISIPAIGENDVLLKKPKFPGQIGGNHGAGIIEKKGRQVSLPEGTHVAFSYYNTWAEYAVLPAEWLIPIPSDLPVEKSGQLVNFISAWDLLEQANLSRGNGLLLLRAIPPFQC
jgi:NADPH:quinone reductase-like Zn-dependent oxidoreductase